MTSFSYHLCPNRDDDDVSINPNEVPQPLCDCGLVAKEKVYWSPGNPAHRFYNCPNSMKLRRSCKFFVWKDEEVSKHYKEMLQSLRNHGVSEELKDENGKLKKVLKLEAHLKTLIDENDRLKKKEAQVKTLIDENDWLKKKVNNMVFWALVAMVVYILLYAWK